MNLASQILFEDNHLLIVNKITGQIVQADKTGEKPLVEYVRDYIKEKYNKPGNVFVGIPHRIDRPTTGIVIFTKTSKALYRMVEQFKERKIKKLYWAVVKNRPNKSADRLIHYLRKNSKNNKSTAFTKETENTKQAILSYEIIKELDNYCLLSVNLETGRHHQIRAQLSAIGCPIRGDLKYNFDRPNADKGINLHARSIEFYHPTQKNKIYIEAPVISTDVIWNFIPEAITSTIEIEEYKEDIT